MPGGDSGARRRNDAVGVAMYLVAAFLFAFNGVVAKAAMNAGFDPVHLTQLRNAGAMVVLAVFVAVTGPQRFRVSRRELPSSPPTASSRSRWCSTCTS